MGLGSAAQAQLVVLGLNAGNPCSIGTSGCKLPVTSVAGVGGAGTGGIILLGVDGSGNPCSIGVAANCSLPTSGGGGAGTITSIAGANTSIQVTNGSGPAVTLSAQFPVQTAKTTNYNPVFTGSGFSTGTDNFTVIPYNCASACTAVMPQSTVSVFPAGSTVAFASYGAAALTVSATTSTIYGPGVVGGTVTVPQGATLQLEADASNNYLASLAFGGPIVFATGTAHTFVAPAEIWECTGTCTVTPPTPAAGYQFCVRNANNVATVITLAAITGVQYENTNFTSYKTANTTIVSGGAAGDKMCIVGKDSTHYDVYAFNGTWS